jgi:hypothetical protein
MYRKIHKIWTVEQNYSLYYKCLLLEEIRDEKLKMSL